MVHFNFLATVTSSGSATGPLSCLSVLVCNVGVLWLNGMMDQDVVWYGGIGLGPGDIVLDGVTGVLVNKRT